jgi:hypothetical protein
MRATPPIPTSKLGARFSHLDELHNGMPLMLRARRLGTRRGDRSCVDGNVPGTAGRELHGQRRCCGEEFRARLRSAELSVTRALTLAAKFDGQPAHNAQSYSGTGTLRYVW